MNEDIKKLKLGAVLFEGFELLDMYGPLELFGMTQNIDIVMLAEEAGRVRSAQGPVSVADLSMREVDQLDILLIPGGRGTRKLVTNESFLSELVRLSSLAEYVCTVCTGTSLLAKAGDLDGVKATTNKRSYQWVTSQGPAVKWIPEARWVEDGKYFTSSGVSAGMDMALGLIEKLFGKEKSLEAANYAEYDWHQDKSWDPFAKKAGLV
ncbi:MAG: DJ-1/PfpI family protein [Verrucomicrobia bacterium]|nr:DJ-1/PfpI family protein [Verrucomicrobiota bacterium]